MGQSTLLSLGLASLFAHNVSTLAFLQPEATRFTGEIHALIGWTPAPTPAPMDSRLPLDLRKRLPQTTFGYEYGNSEDPYTCTSGANLFTRGNVFGCCYTDSFGNAKSNCGPATSCFDYTASSLCTSPCLAVDSLICDATAPYCTGAILYASDVSEGSVTLVGIGCGLSRETNLIYQSVTGGALLAASPLSVPTSTNNTGPTTTTSSFTSSTSSFAAESSPGIQGNGASSGNGDGGSSSGNANSNANGSSTKHTGAIAGGVVGGIAVVALLVGGFIWYRIREKKKDREQPTREMAEVH